MKQLINNILENNIPEFPQQLDLNIPNLNLPQLEKI
mgnify:CR=1 FL=1